MTIKEAIEKGYEIEVMVDGEGREYGVEIDEENGVVVFVAE
jgi:hypothetical protein